MAGGEFKLGQALLHAAQTLEQIRVLCDRTHEEGLTGSQSRESLSAHYAYALGAVMYLVQHELEWLQQLGVRRDGINYEEANERALASLQAFKRSLRTFEGSGPA